MRVPYGSVLPLSYFKPDMRILLDLPKRGSWFVVGEDEQGNIFETESFSTSVRELYDNFSCAEITKMEGKAVAARAKVEERRRRGAWKRKGNTWVRVPLPPGR